MFSKPLNSQGLLENIRIGIGDGDFLKEEFSSDLNLTLVFGNAAIKRVEESERKKYIELNAVPSASIDETACIEPQALYSWWQEDAENHIRRRSVRITVAFRYSDPRCFVSIDTVENLFGQPTQVLPIFGPTPPPHGRNIIQRPQTHRLGNSDVKYVIRGAQSVSTLQFEVLGDGVIRGFGLSQGDE